MRTEQNSCAFQSWCIFQHRYWVSRNEKRRHHHRTHRMQRKQSLGFQNDLPPIRDGQFWTKILRTDVCSGTAVSTLTNYENRVSRPMRCRSEEVFRSLLKKNFHGRLFEKRFSPPQLGKQIGYSQFQKARIFSSDGRYPLHLKFKMWCHRSQEKVRILAWRSSTFSSYLSLGLWTNQCTFRITTWILETYLQMARYRMAQSNLSFLLA